MAAVYGVRCADPNGFAGGLWAETSSVSGNFKIAKYRESKQVRRHSRILHHTVGPEWLSACPVTLVSTTTEPVNRFIDWKYNRHRSSLYRKATTLAARSWWAGSLLASILLCELLERWKLAFCKCSKSFTSLRHRTDDDVVTRRAAHGITAWQWHRCPSCILAESFFLIAHSVQARLGTHWHTLASARIPSYLSRP